MNKTNVFMFPGQGCHYYHMGKKLFDHDPVFNHWIKKGDALCIQFLGESVFDIIYHPQYKQSDDLSCILKTHPAIFIIEYALVKLLQSKGIHPDMVLGASLGEFAAAVCSGMLAYETALEMIIHQALTIYQTCEKGSMLAILASPELYYSEKIFSEISDLAAINYSGGFVISACTKDLQYIQERLREKQIPAQKLAVSHAFHSRHIEPAKTSYLHFIEKITINKPQLPYISSSTSNNVNTINDASYFWKIAREPMNIQKTLTMMENKMHYNYIDLGPSGTFANIVKYNLEPHSQSKIYYSMNPYEDNFKSIEKLLSI